jgi:hypothetical protein
MEQENHDAQSPHRLGYDVYNWREEHFVTADELELQFEPEMLERNITNYSGNQIPGWKQKSVFAGNEIPEQGVWSGAGQLVKSRTRTKKKRHTKSEKKLSESKVKN